MLLEILDVRGKARRRADRAPRNGTRMASEPAVQCTERGFQGDDRRAVLATLVSTWPGKSVGIVDGRNSVPG